jgi:predicted TIM-barrel fold metal-dependent hydrolase
MTDSNEYTLISADSHVLEPPDLFHRLPAHLRSRAPKLGSVNGYDAWMVEGSEPVPLPPTAASGSGYQRFNLNHRKDTPLTFADVLPGLYDPVERLRAQDADSVHAEVLYPSARLWEAITLLDDRDLKLACVQSYNDWIAQFCARSPDRLIGLGKIPSTTCQDARDELIRCVEELNLRGAILDTWPSGSAVAGNADDDPFWDAVDDKKVPVSLHYAVGRGKTTLPPSGIAPGLKPPMADAALPLVAAGVFDRFPQVKLVFAHGNAGWAFHWLEFMDINYVRHRHLDEYAMPDPDAIPSEYIRRYSWFVFHQDRSAVKNRNKLGAAHLMWGSHFPYEDANWPDDREQAMRVTDEVPVEDRQSLLAGNVARLYRLRDHEEGFEAGEVERFEQLVHF